MNTYFIRGLNKFGLLEHLNVNGRILLNEKPFTIPVQEKVGFSNLFMSEPWMVDLLKIILPLADKKFVDVGVNIGQTLLKLRSVSEIDYVGFEPNEQCIHYTKKLIKANNIRNTQLLPVGISDKTGLGELIFFYESTVDSCASIIADYRPDQQIDRKEYVPLFDMNAIKNTIGLDEISVLKVDVEGAELEVLQSFESEIATHQPIIMIEILPAYNAENKTRIDRQNAIQSLLKKHQYNIFRVMKENEKLTELKAINEVGIHGDLNACEYVMVPSAKTAAFAERCKGLNQ
jgi:FkbM family methyltransferase